MRDWLKLPIATLCSPKISLSNLPAPFASLCRRHERVDLLRCLRPESGLTPCNQTEGRLQVNRSWYYGRPTELTIKEADLDFPGYGYRRVAAALRRAGWQVNHKRVHRLMREESLLCQLKRQFVPTSDSQHPYVTYPNLPRGWKWRRRMCSGLPTSPTSGCPPALSIWPASWMLARANVSAGSSPAALIRS